MSKSFDAIVIGAGVSGLYASYSLRERGFKARLFEAGAAVGGTWYWNRYPGARFDSESYSYQYGFSKALFDEWQWSEQFAGQPEIERYLNYVADRFDLKRHIEFDARVASLHYDDEACEWELATADGRRARARHVVAAMGFLSAPQPPDYPGVGDFDGLTVHSARWPKEGIDFGGQRVGIIGSGPTAVQIIQSIAPEAGHLTVFQRTANWCTPLRNRQLSETDQCELAAQADEIVALCKRTFAGFIHDMDARASTEVASRAERRAKYQELYERGGFALWFANYHDLFTNRAFAEEVSEFLAEKIRERVDDPVIAEKLIPKNHPYGTKRPPGETNYYEAFNRDNVTLVDLRATPVTRIVPRGVETSDALYELDALIYATGFQSLTGALLRVDIRGEDGLTLTEKWATARAPISGYRLPASRISSSPADRTTPRFSATRRAVRRPRSTGSSNASITCARAARASSAPRPRPRPRGRSTATTRSRAHHRRHARFLVLRQQQPREQGGEAFPAVGRQRADLPRDLRRHRQGRLPRLRDPLMAARAPRRLSAQRAATGSRHAPRPSR
jgi:cation diffusion facilitator CzcD-associated flavoprotein CzcO